MTRLRVWIATSAAASCLLLTGCGAPDPAAVGKQAKATLQQQLDTARTEDHLVVQSVAVVAVSRPKYDGIATITSGGQSFTIPVQVTSDGKTTIVTADDAKLAEAMQVNLRKRLAVIDGKYSDYVLSPGILALFPASLRKDKADFVGRLETVMPVTSAGGYYLGNSCKAHECGSNEAAWTIDQATGQGLAVVMKTVEYDGSSHLSFRVYGAEPGSLPPPLDEWARNYGMTAMNAVSDPPEYQPPAMN